MYRFERMDCHSLEMLMRHTDAAGYDPLLRYEIRRVMGEKGCPAPAQRPLSYTIQAIGDFFYSPSRIRRR